MTIKEIRINQLKTRNKELRQSLPNYDETPNSQNRILEEIKLNESIIKFLER